MDWKATAFIKATPRELVQAATTQAEVRPTVWEKGRAFEVVVGQRLVAVVLLVLVLVEVAVVLVVVLAVVAIVVIADIV